MISVAGIAFAGLAHQVIATNPDQSVRIRGCSAKLVRFLDQNRAKTIFVRREPSR